MKKLAQSLLAIVFSLSLMFGSVAFTSASGSKPVSQAEAERSAQHFQNLFGGMYYSSWLGASLTGPVVFDSINGEPIAYEYTVVNEGKPIGFILVSANKDLTPFLECNGGPSPSSNLQKAQDSALNEGLSVLGEIPRFLYWGALTYSIQYSGEMQEKGLAVNLPTGRIVNVPTKVDFQIGSYDASEAWQDLNSSFDEDMAPDSLLYTSYNISGVPALCQNHYNQSGGPGDDGYDPYASWPSCAGSYADPWAHWDGCTPISGAMVAGYWDTHGYSYIPDDSELNIDHLHHYMNTSTGGDTSAANGRDGMSAYFALFDYDDDFTFDIETYVGFGDIQDEVNNDDPPILNLINDTYGFHSVTIVGWYESGGTKTIHVHNGWDTSVHIISYGDWAQGTNLFKIQQH